MRAARVDANQRDIDDAARAVGAVIVRASMAPDLGFDRIYGYKGQPHICEIKDPAKPPSARKLTENEQKVKAALEAVGVAYHVIETDDDLYRVFGLKG